MKKFLYYSLVLTLSGSLVLASLTVPVSVANREELAHVKLGLPIPFVIQNMSSYDPPFFPWRFPFVSPWEHPPWVLWPQFFLNIAVVFGVLLLGFRVVKMLTRRLLLLNKPRTGD